MVNWDLIWSKYGNKTTVAILVGGVVGVAVTGGLIDEATGAAIVTAAVALAGIFFQERFPRQTPPAKE